MKRVISLIMAFCLLLTLCGCSRKPTVTAEGTDWDEDWTLVGATIGVEEPGNGLTLLDNKDALAVSDLYYAAWTIGDKTEYVNEDDETVDLYDAQLYVLLEDCKSGEKAETEVAEWQATEEENYSVAETQTVTCAGQEFTVLIYDGTREDNPYSFGASAFAVYENHAINAELTCQEGFEGDAFAILTEFLEGFHYAE
ncbi:MAG: hypothetical protein LUE89_04335 [Clostridiales bacterium]|nr:hypothetical protein [Clostridiales bacterium]